MDSKLIKSTVLNPTIVFVVAYAVYWLAGGLIVNSIDAIYEYTMDVKYVDGWTPGIMFWSLSLYMLPIIFILFLTAKFIWVMKSNAETRER